MCLCGGYFVFLFLSVLAVLGFCLFLRERTQSWVIAESVRIWEKLGEVKKMIKTYL